MKNTMKLLFVNPSNIYDLEQLFKSIKKLPMIVIFENCQQSYVVDTKIKVKRSDKTN